eukprot:1838299-Prymnesium_polylepis.1
MAEAGLRRRGALDPAACAAACGAVAASSSSAGSPATGPAMHVGTDAGRRSQSGGHGWRLPWSKRSAPPTVHQPSAQPNLLVERGVAVAEVFELAAASTSCRGSSTSGAGVGRSYANRLHELVARRAQVGEAGTDVKVLRYPTTWSATATRSSSAPERTSESDSAASPSDRASPRGADTPAARPAGKGAYAPLWFHATVTALQPDTQTCDIEYKPVALEPRFGDGCDGSTMNVLLPDLCLR